MDDRFGKINKLLIAYSVGNFDKKLAMSKRMDEVDAFIAGVNMLGEELKEKTISRNYFNNIFNSVSDMVFVLGKQGRIENINQSVTDLLQYNLKTLAGKHISYLFDKLQPGWFASVLKDLRISGAGSYETVFRTNNKNRIPVLVSASIFLGRQEDKTKILLTAKDISLQKKTQNLILKAIIETEENERMRFAKDIHDSIGQQLSAIKFYIGTSVDAVENPHQKSILLKANAALLDVQADMRNICFNIMPKSIEFFGLANAVQELCSNHNLLDKMKIAIKESPGFPRLPIQQEFAIFRIIQEFINNALKHSKADSLQIEFTCNKNSALIFMSDNGVGFDLKKLHDRGMGLNNVQSRIRPYNGEVEIISKPGKGTKYEISIPLGNKQ
jgi:PAS domain S-box-containing protein